MHSIKVDASRNYTKTNKPAEEDFDKKVDIAYLAENLEPAGSYFDAKNSIRSMILT